MLWPLLALTPVLRRKGNLGRDYITVSRQVTKLEALELAHKQPNAQDRRISEMTLSEQGRAIFEAIAVARQKRMNQVLTACNKNRPPEGDQAALTLCG